MKAWKLTKRCFAPGLVKGEIMFCSLEYYADLEIRSGDRLIGDRLETGGEVHVDHYNNKTATQEMKDRMSMIASGDGEIEIAGLSIKHQHPHAHIFCVTVGDVDDQTALFNYDASVEIIDFEGLAQAIYAEGALTRAPSVKVSDIFSKMECGPVRYEDKVVMMESGLDATSSPFVKPKDYEAQQEVRIVLEAREPLLHDQQFITVPNPERFFSLVPRTHAVEIPTEASPLPLLEELRALAAAKERADNALFADNCRETEELSKKLKAHRVEVRGTASPEFLDCKGALFDPVSDAFIERHSNQQSDLKLPILNLAWRARLEVGLRARGGGVMLQMNALEGLLARHDPGSGPGPAMMYVRETLHFYGQRPPVPVAWIGHELWDTQWP